MAQTVKCLLTMWETQVRPWVGKMPWVLGAVLGIADKMEARPQPPLLVLQAPSRDEGVRSCDSDLFFPFFGSVDWEEC